MRAAQSEHHPRGSRRSCRESLFLAKKSARIVKTAPDAGKKQENKHAAANKSDERKECTLTKTRAKRYVPDMVGKVALVQLLVLQEYFY